MSLVAELDALNRCESLRMVSDELDESGIVSSETWLFSSEVKKGPPPPATTTSAGAQHATTRPPNASRASTSSTTVRTSGSPAPHTTSTSSRLVAHSGAARSSTVGGSTPPSSSLTVRTTPIARRASDLQRSPSAGQTPQPRRSLFAAEQPATTATRSSSEKRPRVAAPQAHPLLSARSASARPIVLSLQPRSTTVTSATASSTARAVEPRQLSARSLAAPRRSSMSPERRGSTAPSPPSNQKPPFSHHRAAADSNVTGGTNLPTSARKSSSNQRAGLSPRLVSQGSTRRSVGSKSSQQAPDARSPPAANSGSTPLPTTRTPATSPSVDVTLELFTSPPVLHLHRRLSVHSNDDVDVNIELVDRRTSPSASPPIVAPIGASPQHTSVGASPPATTAVKSATSKGRSSSINDTRPSTGTSRAAHTSASKGKAHAPCNSKMLDKEQATPIAIDGATQMEMSSLLERAEKPIEEAPSLLLNTVDDNHLHSADAGNTVDSKLTPPKESDKPVHPLVDQHDDQHHTLPVTNQPVKPQTPHTLNDGTSTTQDPPSVMQMPPSPKPPQEGTTRQASPTVKHNNTQSLSTSHVIVEQNTPQRPTTVEASSPQAQANTTATTTKREDKAQGKGCCSMM